MTTTAHTYNPERPSNLPHGRWLGDLEPLSVAEKALVKACAKGEIWKPKDWDGERPKKSTVANTIRGGVIRFLGLGGDALHPAHELGVMAFGAWINGELDLHQAKAAVRLALQQCHFVETPIFIGTHLPELMLTGCAVPGLDADGIKVMRSVFLRDGFAASGAVRLPGAQIGDDLDCSKGSFTNADGNALVADRLKVTGGVFLRDGFVATGAVRLPDAQIGRNLDCGDGRFTNTNGEALVAGRLSVTGGVFLCDGFVATGAVVLLSAEIGGDLDCRKGSFAVETGNALDAQGMKLSGAMVLREAAIGGAVDLASARIGTLVDGDLACWEAGGHFLDGFHYERIAGSTKVNGRIAWLKSQQAVYLTTDFKPQPWEQLIKVLREMGHPYEAGQVAIAKQDQMRVAGLFKGRVRSAMHWLYGTLAGYGHRPIWTVYWMLGVWLGCAFFFQVGGSYGYFGPTTPLLTNPQIAARIDATCGNRRETTKQIWTECKAMPAEYTTFQPLAYSADLILPLVNLQQDEDWAPIVSVPTGENMGFGVFLRWLMWFEILFGWTASLMLVAVLGRLVDKD